jgi:hypothetical protein
MGAEFVQDDDVSGFEFRHQNLLDIDAKAFGRPPKKWTLRLAFHVGIIGEFYFGAPEKIRAALTGVND